MDQPNSNTPPETAQETTGVIADVQEEQNVPQYERHEPTFFAMVPKMAQMDLAPYELALYCNLKQTASDGGAVTKSNRTLAFETHMSIAQVKRARKALEVKGYIRVEHRVDEQGNQNQTNIITLRDVWALNHHRFKTQKEFMTGVALTEPGGVLTEPGGGSARTPSNNHKSKNQRKRKDSAVVTADTRPAKKDDPLFDAITTHIFHLNPEQVKATKSGGRIAKLKKWLVENQSGVTPEDIAAFARHYGKYAPLDVTKFGEAWLRWKSERSSAPRAPVYVPPEVAPQPSGVTAEQVRKDREQFEQLTAEKNDVAF